MLRVSKLLSVYICFKKLNTRRNRKYTSFIFLPVEIHVPSTHSKLHIGKFQATLLKHILLKFNYNPSEKFSTFCEAASFKSAFSKKKHDSYSGKFFSSVQSNRSTFCALCTFTISTEYFILNASKASEMK